MNLVIYNCISSVYRNCIIRHNWKLLYFHSDFRNLNEKLHRYGKWRSTTLHRFYKLIKFYSDRWGRVGTVSSLVAFWKKFLSWYNLSKRKHVFTISNNKEMFIIALILIKFGIFIRSIKCKKKNSSSVDRAFSRYSFVWINISKYCVQVLQNLYDTLDERIME